jgi:hypothetical protein
MNIHPLVERKIVKEKCRLAANQLGIKLMINGPRRVEIFPAYRRFRASRASATDFSIRAASSRTPPTLIRKKVLPFNT